MIQYIKYKNSFYKRFISIFILLNKTFQMKKATVIGISSNQKLILLLQQNKNIIQSKLQGFDICQDQRYRIFFDELLNKDIQISFNKNQKMIRYQNQSFLIKSLQIGALSLNQKQIDQSKLFNSQHKNNFISNSQINKNQNLFQNIKDLNHKSQQSLLKQLIKQQRQLQAKVEYFSQFIFLRIKIGQQKFFLKCYLSNFKQYFQLFPQTIFWKTNILPLQTKITINSIKYNLNTNQNDIFVQFNEDIQSKLLSQGLIALNPKTLIKIRKENIVKLSSVQKQAIKQNKGIYSSKSQILGFIYAKNNYVGIVTKIIEGYIFQVTSLKTKQTDKVQLSMIVCPIGQDGGSYECRQFARKNLIGKQVNVYLQKQEGLNTTGSIIRNQDWKDVQSLILENGYARVREQLKGSVLGQKYIAIQNKAKQKKKGIHKKDLGNKRLQDLSQSPLNKSHLNTFLPRRLQVLSQISQSQAAVIQQVVNVLTYKIRIESLQILINMRLQGILQPFLNPNLKQYQQIQQQTQRFINRNLNQRNVIASIIDFDQQNNEYIGTLVLQKQKLEIQHFLLKASLVYADKYGFISKYIELESQVKKQKKLIWQDKLKCFEPGNQLDRQKYCFEGRFSWIKHGKIAYVQPKDNFKTIQQVQNKIRSITLNPLKKQSVKVDAWCAAPYEGQFYRALIKSKKDNNVTVQFFDWGNQQIIKITQLKQLPQQYLYLQKQCIKVTLNLVAKTRNKQANQKLRQYLFEGGIYVFKKVYGDLVDFYDSQTTSLNQQLITKGYLKADKQQIKVYENRQLVKQVQQELRKQRIGIWEDQSDSSQQQSEHY